MSTLHHKDNYVFWDLGCHEPYFGCDEPCKSDTIHTISVEEGNNMIKEIHRILENTTEDDEMIVICDSLGSFIQVRSTFKR